MSVFGYDAIDCAYKRVLHHREIRIGNVGNSTVVSRETENCDFNFSKPQNDVLGRCAFTFNLVGLMTLTHISYRFRSNLNCDSELHFSRIGSDELVLGHLV